MNEYFPDVFYDVSKLTLQDKISILQDAKDKCISWNVDILDCNKSWARQYIDMSWEDIVKKLDDSSHFVIIHRRGYVEWKKFPDRYRWCLEIGFSTYHSPSYFLWIYINEDELYWFINKYKLVILNQSNQKVNKC